jgi:hypothetical protein
VSVEDAIRILENSGDEDEIGEINVDNLIERARAEGFNVTLEDLGAAAGQMIVRLTEPGALDDDELDAISGGHNPKGSRPNQNYTAQKAAQLTDLLNSMRKAIEEMKHGTSRNIL